MKKLVIFDPAMCCPTGICGPSVDPELLRIASVINKLQKKGVCVERYNPNNSPQAFLINRTINQLLNQYGIGILPVTMVDNAVVKTGSYLTNEELCKVLKLPRAFFKDIPGSIGSKCVSGCKCGPNCDCGPEG